MSARDKVHGWLYDHTPWSWCWLFGHCAACADPDMQSRTGVDCHFCFDYGVLIPTQQAGAQQKGGE